MHETLLLSFDFLLLKLSVFSFFIPKYFADMLLAAVDLTMHLAETLHFLKKSI